MTEAGEPLSDSRAANQGDPLRTNRQGANVESANSGVGDRRAFLKASFGFAIVAAIGGIVSNPASASCIAASPDNACVAGGVEPDLGCHMTPHPQPAAPGQNLHDEDNTCAQIFEGLYLDVDNACGDCDDNHDTDQSCGKALIVGQPARDRDELCGHPHYFGGNEDQRCGKSASATPGINYSDEGCGTHNPVYTFPGAWTDPDSNKGNLQENGTVDPDNDCSSGSADQNCNVQHPAYSTDPDEKCSSTDVDQACGVQNSGPGTNPVYDQDESCGSGNADEACGGNAVPFHDFDQNCSATDSDEGCRSMEADPDQSSP